MPHTFSGTPVKATSTKVHVDSDERLPGRPSPKFVYAHNPSNWSFDPVHGFLPVATKIPIRPGVNGCGRPPNGHVAMLSGLRAQGWIILDESGPIRVTNPDTGEIVEDAGYLLLWEGKKGKIYQDVWSWPTLIGRGNSARVDWSSQFDHDGFKAWLIMLRDTGVVPPISPGVASRLLKVQERRADRRLSEGHSGNPHIQAHVKAEHKTLDRMKDAALSAGAKVKGRRGKDSGKKRGPGRPRKVRADVD